MLKCEDVLMSSDLFTNESLFTNYSTNNFSLNNDDPFDFLNTPEKLQNVSTNNLAENQTERTSELLEDSPTLLFSSDHSLSSGVAEKKTQNISSSLSEILETTVNNPKPKTVKVTTNSPVTVPKVTIANKDVNIKIAPQTIRNIQPKPDTSSYRIVPLKSVNNIQNAQSQTVKIHSPSPVSATENGTRSPTETVIKNVIPLADLLNSGISKPVCLKFTY